MALGAAGLWALGALLGCFYAVGLANLCRNVDYDEWVAAAETNSGPSETAIIEAATPDGAIVRIERAVYVADEPAYAPTAEPVAALADPIEIDSALVLEDAANGWEPAVDVADDLVVGEANPSTDALVDMDALFDETIVADDSVEETREATHDAVLDEEDYDASDLIELDSVVEENEDAVEVETSDDAESDLESDEDASLADLINIDPDEDDADAELDESGVLLDDADLETEDDGFFAELLGVEADEDEETETEAAESDAELDEAIEEPIDDEDDEVVGDVESIVESDAAVEIEASQDVEVAIETGDESVVEETAETADAEDVAEAVEEDVAEAVEEDFEEAVPETVEEAVEEDVAEADEGTVEEAVEEIDSEWQEVVSTEWQSGEQAVQNAAPEQTDAVAPVSVESAPVEALSDQAWIVMSNGSGFFCQVFENGVWRVASLDEFYANDSANRSTVVWAHGFQTDMSDAMSDAFAFRSTLDRARAAVGSNRACRLVVWKWASERATLRIAPDARMKMQIADYEGVRLAKFIGGVDGSNNVSLVGFSFGARVVGSALQTLATTPSRYMSDARTGKISLMLVSAACDYGAFDYGAYAQGSKLASCVLNVYNPSDYALRYYPFVSETRSSALGVAPICGAGFVNAEGRMFNMSSQSVVGRDHSFTDVIKCVPRELLLESLL